jgi:hypothetical protein
MVAVPPLLPLAPAPAVRSVSPESLRTAQAAWPGSEPDRTVWRVLSVAGDTPLSDEQLALVLPGVPLAEIAAARARVAHRVAEVPAQMPTSLEALLAEPSITLDEAVALGLAEDVRGCASST